MLLIALDRKDPEPAYRQIAGKIEKLIATGVIHQGEILPPTRRLARQLGVSRYTVTSAYQELWARGCLSSKQGSYSRALGARPRTQHAARASASPRGVIDFSSYRLDETLFPMRELRKALQRVSADGNAGLLQRGEPHGWMPLRRTIAARLRSHSIPAEPENILITNGALHGLDLCFRLLAPVNRDAVPRADEAGSQLAPRAGSGGKVIVEEPTFSSALNLCRLHGMTPAGVPLGPDGMDLKALRKKLSLKDLRFLFTIPTFQNPSGITTSRERREEILSLCSSCGLPIVEDAFEEEMSYFGNVVLPLKSMDRNGGVISLGTFSKVLFPGPRVGWIAAEGAVIEKLSAIRCASDDGGSMLMQAALNELCESGAYQKHLEALNRTSARRMRTALDVLSACVPPDRASWTRPNGGYLIWLTLAPTDVTEQELHAHLLSHGVDAKPGSGCFTRPQERLHLRLSISALAEEQIAEGIRRLGNALEELQHRQKPMVVVSST